MAGTISSMAQRNRLQLFLAYLDRKQAFLTGLPHLLYTLRLTLPGLAGGTPAWELPAAGLFALSILYGLLRGLGPNFRNPPRWVGSWVGYALLLVLELILGIFPGSPAGTFGGIIWLVGYSAAIIYLGRGYRMRAVLAVLPVAPVFIWSMALDAALAAPEKTVLGPALGSTLFAGLVVAVASALFDGFIWGSQVFWTVVIATLVGGLPVAYISQFLEMNPSGKSGSVSGMVGALLGYLIAVGIFSWPAWVGWFWDWVKRKVTTGI